jgi:hypothetical protein
VSAGAFILSFNGAEPPPQLQSLPLLPPTTKIQDSMLAMLLHSLFVTGQPAVCVLVPGKLAPLPMLWMVDLPPEQAAPYM